MERNEIIWMVIALIAVAGFLVTAYGASQMFQSDVESCKNYMTTNCVCRTGNEIVPWNLSHDYNIGRLPTEVSSGT